MKNLVFVAVLLVVVSSFASAQDVAFNGILRTAVKTDGTGQSFNMAELYVEKGKWIPIDVGVIVFPNGRTAEIFVGGGRTLVANKNYYLVAELYLDKEVGQNTAKGLYLQPWVVTGGSFGSSVKWQVCAFPYLPVNKSGTFQFVLERAKITYATKVGDIGGGLGGYRFGDGRFQYKPFVTYAPSWKPVKGLEFWYQRNVTTGQSQVQVRYAIRIPMKKK